MELGSPSGIPRLRSELRNSTTEFVICKRASSKSNTIIFLESKSSMNFYRKYYYKTLQMTDSHF